MQPARRSSRRVVRLRVGRPVDGSTMTLWIFPGLFRNFFDVHAAFARSHQNDLLRHAVDTRLTYSSFLMSAPSSISRRLTFWPSGRSGA
jgi:hypothetical protein